MNFSTVVPMLNSVDRLLKLLKLFLSIDITEFEFNNLEDAETCSRGVFSLDLITADRFHRFLSVRNP